MHPNALLEADIELVHRVLRFEHPADRVVADFFREQRMLGARATARPSPTGAFELMRRLPYYRHLASSANGGRGEIERRLAILTWQGNDGVLRAGLDDGERAWLRAAALSTPELARRLRHNLPDWLAAPLRQRLGDEFWEWVDATSAPAAARPARQHAEGRSAMRCSSTSRRRVRCVAATPHSPLGIRVVGKPALQKADVFEQGSSRCRTKAASCSR
jgi:16S rRNA (cytosine967-C5)-methyltransferase